MKLEKKLDGYLLDVQGYACPHPEVYTKHALEKMKGGEVLELLFDNPTTLEIVAAMCDSSGYEIVDKVQGRGTFSWKIKKA